MRSRKFSYVATAFAMMMSIAAVKVGAETSRPGPAVTDAHAVIENMAARNRSLQSFQAQLHITGHLTSFPFFGTKLDGMYLFKRPDSYQVAFGHSSRWGDAIKNLVLEVGDPESWETTRNVAIDPQTQTPDGRSVICLRITAKVDSDQLDYALATIDRTTYDLTEMQWHYRDGATVFLTQTYDSAGRYRFVASQHAEVHAHGIRAVADATYTDYETNVQLDDTRFATNK